MDILGGEGWVGDETGFVDVAAGAGSVAACLCAVAGFVEVGLISPMSMGDVVFA
jgi:hypothetical protein